MPQRPQLRTPSIISFRISLVSVSAPRDISSQWSQPFAYSPAAHSRATSGPRPSQSSLSLLTTVAPVVTPDESFLKSTSSMLFWSLGGNLPLASESRGSVSMKMILEAPCWRAKTPHIWPIGPTTLSVNIRTSPESSSSQYLQKWLPHRLCTPLYREHSDKKLREHRIDKEL
jgi:hypothetical protein